MGKKAKNVETSYAIADSTAKNKKNMEKIKARQVVMQQIGNDVKERLPNAASGADLITKLIVQGLLMLLEDNVVVRCREVDKGAVQGCLARASDEYSKAIKAESAKDKKVALTLDKVFLPPPPQKGQTDERNTCLGGVLLLCKDGKITIDNTLDVRLNLVMEQAKPAIRELLFPK